MSVPVRTEPAFEALLAAWLTDPAGWPRERTFEMFQEWFEIQMTSVVEDLYLDCIGSA